jgi:hypothetical protein
VVVSEGSGSAEVVASEGSDFEWGGGYGWLQLLGAGRDVLLVILTGSATVTVDGEARLVEAGQAIALAKARARRIAAGPEAVRYLSVHPRRPPLQVSPARVP